MTVRSGPNEEEANRGGQSAPDAAAGGQAGSVSARVEDVLEAAERAAAAIREEASQWASKHIENARQEAGQLAGKRARELSRLAEELITAASAVVKQSDEFLRALDQTAGTAADNGATVGEDTASPISDQARLLAAQMAVAEAPRDEIAQRLHEEFGIQDAGPMLDRMGI
jgi:ABC-type transporter Mla subunit MlaD